MLQKRPGEGPAGVCGRAVTRHGDALQEGARKVTWPQRGRGHGGEDGGPVPRPRTPRVSRREPGRNSRLPRGRLGAERVHQRRGPRPRRRAAAAADHGGGPRPRDESKAAAIVGARPAVQAPSADGRSRRRQSAGRGGSEGTPRPSTRRIANGTTRAAYGRAGGQFLAWCEARGLGPEAVSPLHVAAYIGTHPGSVPTVKKHLAAIRMLCDWLVVSQVLPVNPAAARAARRSTSSPRARRGSSRRPRPGSSLTASTRGLWSGSGTELSSR